MAEFILSIGVWGVALTLSCFALGTWINKKTGQALCNPLLLAAFLSSCSCLWCRSPLGNIRKASAF